MPQLKEFTFRSGNAVNNVYVRGWLPDGPVRGTVQLAHGIAEYVQRYDPFMQFLANEGYAVYANDHIGHGRSSLPNRLGYVGDSAGWNIMVGDMLTLHKTIAAGHPDCPHFLFGHSMGSFLARTFMIKYGELLSGCVLSGTGHPPKALTMGARALARVEVKRHGPGYYSELLNNVMNGQYNGGYENPRTPYDWISSDPSVVDAYIADPQCGYVPTAGLMSEMLKGVDYITSQRNIDKMPKDLPIYFVSGASDPVGELSAGVMRAYKAFLKVGMKDVSLKLYPGMRHEILNDVDRDEVMVDILAWLNDKC